MNSFHTHTRDKVSFADQVEKVNYKKKSQMDDEKDIL